MINVQDVHSKIADAVDSLVDDLAEVFREYLQGQLGTVAAKQKQTKATSKPPTSVGSCLEESVQIFIQQSEQAVPMKDILQRMASIGYVADRHQLRRVLLKLMREGQICLNADRAYQGL